MKRWGVLVMLVGVLLTACTSRTEFGECVGLNGEKDPKLVYKYNTRNIIVGVLLWEMIVPPVYVALEQLECPVGTHPTKEATK